MRGETGVVEAVGSLKKEEATGLEDPGDFAVAFQRRGEMFGDVVVKDEIKCVICEWERLRAGLIALVEERIAEDTWVGIDANVAGDFAAQVKMMLMISP